MENNKIANLGYRFMLSFYSIEIILLIYQKFSWETLGMVILFGGILSFMLLYKWKLIAGNENYPEYKTLANILSYSRKTVIVVSFLTPLLCIGFNLTHENFPPWQRKFICTHFTRLEEINELNPIKFSMDSLKNHPVLSKPEQPVLLVNHSSTLYFFDNSVINAEMIRYLSDAFNGFILAFTPFILIAVLVFLMADLIVTGKKIDGKAHAVKHR